MSLPTRLRNHRHIIANLGYASPPHLISSRLDMALCHNSALVFKLDPRTITCNLISEFNSYPTIFSNWHFIDIFIYSFWLSGSEEMQCSAISPIPSNFSSWNRTIGLQILYATVIQRRRSAPVNRRPHAARARQESNLKNMVLETMRRPSAQA